MTLYFGHSAKFTSLLKSGPAPSTGLRLQTFSTTKKSCSGRASKEIIRKSSPSLQRALGSRSDSAAAISGADTAFPDSEVCKTVEDEEVKPESLSKLPDSSLSSEPALGIYNLRSNRPAPPSFLEDIKKRSIETRQGIPKDDSGISDVFNFPNSRPNDSANFLNQTTSSLTDEQKTLC